MRHYAQTRPSESGTSHRTKGSGKPQKTAVKNESNDTDVQLELSDILNALPFYVME